MVARRHSGNADLDREEIKDASPSQTSTVGPRNSGAKKAPLGENVVFHSPVLIKAVEGRDAVAAIFATSASVRTQSRACHQASIVQNTRSITTFFSDAA